MRAPRHGAATGRSAALSAVLGAISALGACTDTGLVGGLCPVGCADAGPPVIEAPCSGAACPDAQLPDDPAACSGAPATLVRKRLDLLAVVDNGASLGARWPAIGDALARFYTDDASRGVGLGLQSFGMSCDPADYEVPRVPIASLPENADALRAAFSALVLENTSTLPAIQGAANFARAHRATHLDAEVALVLITDGFPGDCDSLQIWNAAAASANPEPQPPIYSVSFQNSVVEATRQFAAQNGVELEVETTDGTLASIAGALRTVRAKALPCSFALPEGAALDAPARVQLRAPGGSTRSFALAPDGACTDPGGGFFVLAGNTPYRLFACPHTCERLSVDSQVVLYTGCAAP